MFLLPKPKRRHPRMARQKRSDSRSGSDAFRCSCRGAGAGPGGASHPTLDAVRASLPARANIATSHSLALGTTLGLGSVNILPLPSYTNTTHTCSCSHSLLSASAPDTTQRSGECERKDKDDEYGCVIELLWRLGVDKPPPSPAPAHALATSSASRRPVTDSKLFAESLSSSNFASLSSTASSAGTRLLGGKFNLDTLLPHPRLDLSSRPLHVDWGEVPLLIDPMSSASVSKARRKRLQLENMITIVHALLASSASLPLSSSRPETLDTSAAPKASAYALTFPSSPSSSSSSSPSASDCEADVLLSSCTPLKLPPSQRCSSSPPPSSSLSRPHSLLQSYAEMTQRSSLPSRSKHATPTGKSGAWPNSEPAAILFPAPASAPAPPRAPAATCGGTSSTSTSAAPPVAPLQSAAGACLCGLQHCSSRSRPAVIVDFCSGGDGFLGLLLAYLFPHCLVRLVDSSAQVVAKLERRLGVLQAQARLGQRSRTCSSADAEGSGPRSGGGGSGGALPPLVTSHARARAHTHTDSDVECVDLASPRAPPPRVFPFCNVRIHRARAEEFAEPFDLAVALHPCGGLGDSIAALAMGSQAGFVIAPCCPKKIRYFTTVLYCTVLYCCYVLANSNAGFFSSFAAILFCAALPILFSYCTNNKEYFHSWVIP